MDDAEAQREIARELERRAEEDRKERLRLYERTRDELIANARSASENYDRALLTLSSAFLGGSLAFIERVVGQPISKTIGQWLLYASWSLFAVTIILTLASFVYSLFKAQAIRDAAERYYMKDEQEAAKVPFKIQRVVLAFIAMGGTCFILAVSGLGVYVYRNVTTEHPMPIDPKKVEKSIPPATFQVPTPPQPSSPPPSQAPAQPPQKSGS